MASLSSFIGVHSDCSAYQPLPINLDNIDGGSAPFGGPMQRGYVHISGDSFIASGLGTASSSSATMACILDYDIFCYLIALAEFLCKREEHR